jgi:hypothetical protein
MPPNTPKQATSGTQEQPRFESNRPCRSRLMGKDVGWTRMPERFTQWCPAGVTAESVSLLSLHDDRDGLVVRVEASGRTIEIAFGIVAAFRSTLEESCLAFWPKFHGAKPTHGPFWTVAESEWLASSRMQT